MYEVMFAVALFSLSLICLQNICYYIYCEILTINQSRGQKSDIYVALSDLTSS